MIKVTIEQTEVETVLLPKSYEKIGEEQWAYVDEVETKKTVTREIYSQTLDSIDLAAVIKAVNKI